MTVVDIQQTGGFFQISAGFVLMLRGGVGFCWGFGKTHGFTGFVKELFI
ncbi:MAG: hypothetical protein LUG57_07895 [Oscillospiraceae bacterium]|nr:hypothetical protein [Oscillospiraceae bacterium]